MERDTASHGFTGSSTAVLPPLDAPRVTGLSFAKVTDPSGLRAQLVSTPSAGITTLSMMKPPAFSSHTVSPPLDSPKPSTIEALVLVSTMTT